MEVLHLETESENPNLDGDFKALLEIQKNKKHKINTNNNADVLPLGKIAAVPEEDEKSIVSEEASITYATAIAPPQELVSIYKSLIDAVKQDDPEKCRTACMELHQANKTLGDPEMRNPDNGATALHVALDSKSKKVAEFFIQYSNEDFLLEECEVVIKNVPSKKTCLHFLVELGDMSLFQAFLLKIPDGRAKDEFLRKTVLTEMKGQRPRHLSAIHLVSLHGHIEILDKLIKLGVEVDTTNNKNDTPVLWAARGNNINMVRRLIHYKADLNMANDKGSTPLYFAVRYGFNDLAKVLLTEGNCDLHQKRKLGLGYPIILASALGYDNIVETLLDHGANPRAEINGGQTSLHYAAAMGNEEVVEILLHNGVHVDDSDDMGNTALMIAVRAGSLNVVRQLIAGHCNINAKNKFGETIWDFAVDQPDDNLLKQIIQLYRQLRRMTGRKTIFPIGKSPLHVAALKADMAKIRCLFQLGVDPKSEDSSGNTFIHYAARDDSVTVLQEFLTDGDADQKNADEDTPLHIAVKNGHIESVEILLKKSKLTNKNSNGYTPLHVACASPHCTPQIVNILVEVIVKTNNWSLVDEKDNLGNTALHLAAKRGRYDLIIELDPLNVMIPNREGDTPLHIAGKGSRAQTLEELLRVFNKPGKGLNLDQENEEGETLLHICAKRGDSEQVEMLIAAGCDLAVKNKEGNSVLHELVEQSVLEPSNKENLLEVFQTIEKNSVLWWCMKGEHHLPEEDSEPYIDMRKEAILFLTSSVYNHQAMNAVVFAASLGAITMLQAIFDLKDVYKFIDHQKITYDITHVAPETVPEKIKSRKASHFGKGAVGAFDEVIIKNAIGYDSCLDIVTTLENEVLATQVLDISPIKQLVANYWRAYQWIYGLLIIVHIVYMSLFTVYSIDSIVPSANVTSGSDTYAGMGLFLLWPALLVTFELYYLIASVMRVCKRKQKGQVVKKSSDNSRCCSFSPLQVPAKVLTLIVNNLTHIALLLFCSLIVAWFIMYKLQAGNAIAYVIAIALIVGWLFTITFTKGFETVHAFSIMLKYIILRDISRFLVIYVFILLAFALALHASVRIVPDIASEYPSTWDSIFMTFNMMLGMDDLFGGDYSQAFTDAGVNPVFSKLVYIAYLIMATIILLNLLIAMMSDTYSDIKSREGTTWRIGSVRLALQIERKMPFLKRFFKWVGVIDNRIQVDPDTNRFKMTLLPSETRQKHNVVEDELTKFMTRLDSKLDHLKTQYMSLAEQVDEIAMKQEYLFHGEKADVGAFPKAPSRSRRKSSLLQAAESRQGGGRKKSSSSKNVSFSPRH